jgi:hypothetical protein
MPSSKDGNLFRLWRTASKSVYILYRFFVLDCICLTKLMTFAGPNDAISKRKIENLSINGKVMAS